MAINFDDYVRVKNGTLRHIVGRYDGIDYKFPPGKSRDVPVAVAAHVFGFGRDEKYKESVFARLGWATNSEQMDAAREELAKITFDPVPPVPGSDEYETEDETVIEDTVPSRNNGSATSAPSALSVGDAGGRETAPPRNSQRKTLEDDDQI